MTLQVPTTVRDIIQRLETAGFETWCVGGAVRDHLLGIDNHDFDLATAATPAQVQALFPRNIPVGIEHGTIVVLDENKDRHEVTTFRRDKDTDGRHAKVEFGVSLDEDLARRDFTINAIAYHPVRDEFRDPFAGREDIRNSVIRAVGEAGKRFQEDYLRILRMVRFAVRFGFAIDPATWEAAVAQAAGLSQLSAERVREEWFGALRAAKNPNMVVAMWYELGALDRWLPEVHLSAQDIGALGNDPILLTLYMSIDPPATLRRLKCSKVEIGRAEGVVKYISEYPDPAKAVEVRRWIAKVGKHRLDLIDLAQLLPIGKSLAEAVRFAEIDGVFTTGQLALRGNELGDAGVPHGPMIGEVLRYLLDVVLEDPTLNNRDVLLVLVENYVTQHLPVLPPAILEVPADEILPEYDFKGALPNPYAGAIIGVDMASGPDRGFIDGVETPRVTAEPAQVPESYCQSEPDSSDVGGSSE